MASGPSIVLTLVRYVWFSPSSVYMNTIARGNVTICSKAGLPSFRSNQFFKPQRYIVPDWRNSMFAKRRVTVHCKRRYKQTSEQMQRLMIETLYDKIGAKPRIYMSFGLNERVLSFVSFVYIMRFIVRTASFHLL